MIALLVEDSRESHNRRTGTHERALVAEIDEVDGAHATQRCEPLVGARKDDLCRVVDCCPEVQPGFSITP